MALYEKCPKCGGKVEYDSAGEGVNTIRFCQCTECAFYTEDLEPDIPALSRKQNELYNVLLFAGLRLQNLAKFLERDFNNEPFTLDEVRQWHSLLDDVIEQAKGAQYQSAIYLTFKLGVKKED